MKTLLTIFFLFFSTLGYAYENHSLTDGTSTFVYWDETNDVLTDYEKEYNKMKDDHCICFPADEWEEIKEILRELIQ